MLEPILRLVVSLAVVIGLLLATMRVARRTMRSRPGSLVRVVQRQSLSRTSGLAVVEVAGRTLVLGTTEHQVSLLVELDERLDDELDGFADEAESDGDDDAAVIDLRPTGATHDAFAVELISALEEDAAADAVEVPRRLRRTSASASRPVKTPAERPATSGPLAGSVLSPDTWRQAVAAVRGGR